MGSAVGTMACRIWGGETDLLEEEPLSETVESDVAALDDTELNRLDRDRYVVQELWRTPEMLLVYCKGHDVPDRLDLVERYHVETREGVEVYLVIWSRSSKSETRWLCAGR